MILYTKFILFFCNYIFKWGIIDYKYSVNSGTILQFMFSE